MLSGDEATVRRRLATPGATERKDAYWGLTPLAWATMRGDPEIVAAVLDAGGTPDERDQGGNTPLHHAAYFGRDAAARLLIERGANPTAVNVVGRMPAASDSCTTGGLRPSVISTSAAIDTVPPVSAIIFHSVGVR